MAAAKSGSGFTKWIVLILLAGGAWYLGDAKFSATGQKLGPLKYVVGWRGKGPAAAIEYRTNVISRGDIVQSITANGSLTPEKLIEVGSQVSGIINEVLVDFNSPVKAGDVIAKIDPAMYERSLAQAKADLANVKAALEMAQFNAKRGKELFAAKLISETEYTQSEVSLHQAEAQVEMRDASVERAKVDLERTTIYAPVNGIVITRAIEAGQTVAASFNTPRLFTIANSLAKMQIEAAVSEADIGGVENGQRVNFTVDAFPSRQFRGTVKQVRFAPTTNQNVVTYTTVVEVDNPDLKLRPGMTANANIVTAEKKNVLRIPLAALRFRPPEGANILKAPTPASGANSATASTGQTSTVQLATSGPYAGLPIQPWAAERRRPTDEERAKYVASLTPEQREKYEEARERMRQMMAEGGGGGGGGGGRGSRGEGGGGSGSSRSSDAPTTRTLYLMVKDDSGDSKQPTLKQITVKTGISDGASYIECIEGLSEGDIIVTGAITPQTSTAATPPAGASPFGGSPFGGGGGGGGPRRF